MDKQTCMDLRQEIGEEPCEAAEHIVRACLEQTVEFKRIKS